jgi:POT family proton-dependent oligopeptide transporter
MQNKSDISVPGALGFGQSRATFVYNTFYFVSYLTPIPMAVLADTLIGRYQTLLLGLL